MNKTKKKYAVHPGFVFSRNDGQRHYVDFVTLCRLYGIQPEEAYDADNLRGAPRARLQTLIDLYPDYTGEYKLPTVKK